MVSNEDYKEDIKGRMIGLTVTVVKPTRTVTRYSKNLFALELPLIEVIEAIIASTDRQALDAVIALLTPED